MSTDGITVRGADWADDEAALTRVRSAVFILEQGVPRAIEMDGQDPDARHVLAEHDGLAVGCGRLLPDGRIGRIAVLASHRGLGIGARLLEALLDLARNAAMVDVYLHSQASATAFYTRAGFEARGPVFEEAGIPHQDMQLTLDYRRWNERLVHVAYPRPFDQLVLAQLHHARRELRLLSPALDPRVFDGEPFLAALRQFIRESRLSNARVIVRESRPLVQSGHGLLQMARRLPSRVELRVLREHGDWNGDSQVIRDRDSLLTLPGGESSPALYAPDDRPRTERAVERYEELWRAAAPDPEFRALSI